jgi:hypothetical protein
MDFHSDMVGYSCLLFAARTPGGRGPTGVAKIYFRIKKRANRDGDEDQYKDRGGDGNGPRFTLQV